MNDSAILGHLVMGHSLMIDRDRNVVATRLTIFPDRRDAAPDPAALIDALLGVWPRPEGADALPQDVADEGPVTLTLRDVAGAAGSPAPAAKGGAAAKPPVPGVPTTATPVSLNIASEPWLRALLAHRPPPHVMIEVPAFMTGDAEIQAALKTLQAGGSTLVIKGRPVNELSRELLPCFRHSIIDVSEERRDADAPAGALRQITSIQTGVNTRADVDAAFARGAVAVLGWPIGGAAADNKKPAGPDMAVVMQLIQRVDSEEPVERLEAVLRNDPQLAFRLLRYMNSAAFGLTVEITSFRHALMMLGYKKLKRWLALLLASANPDPALRPAIHAAVRRGLLMEELARGSMDPEARSEMFICGVFSLLDRMLGQPFAALFDSLPVPETVRQALVDNAGPCAPYLALARSLEAGMRADIREAADNAFMGMDEVNAALLRALKSARELENA